MLVQLNSPQDDRPYRATGTGLPMNAPATKTLSPVVAVLGPAGRVAGLPAHLPACWSVRRARDLNDVRADEIVLFSNASERDVATARELMPRRTRIVALVDDRAPAGLVAAVLTAGADVCVRGGQPAILAGHLVACRRRQLADRWADLYSAVTAAMRD